MPIKDNSSVGHHLLYTSGNDDDDEEDGDWRSTATKASVKSDPKVSNDISVNNVQMKVATKKIYRRNLYFP